MIVVQQALILAGGRGTRLGALTDDCPKPLLAVAGRPFIDYLLGSLGRHGVHQFMLSTGYRAEMFHTAFPAGSARGRTVTHCIEPEPAGTGGAVALARPQLDEVFLVLNGDTIFDIEYQALAADLAAHPDALAAIALRAVDDTGRYGCVRLEGNLVRTFAEKSAGGPGLINGGIYCVKREALDLLPRPPCSLERDLFPALAAQGRLAGRKFEGYFIDIGLPETLARAQAELPAWEHAAVQRASRP